MNQIPKLSNICWRNKAPVDQVVFENINNPFRVSLVSFLTLDNVDRTLIGECEVKTTGHWLSYKQYTCNVDNVEGRHDLYIIFKGIENYYLVNMKAFWFE